MKKQLSPIIIILLVSLSTACTGVEISIRSIDTESVVLNFRVCGEISSIKSILLYRSYIDLKEQKYLDLYAQPITKVEISNKFPKGQYTDSLVAQNCRYYYYMKAVHSDNSMCGSNVVDVAVPDFAIQKSNNCKPALYIDKVNYFLEVRNGSIPLKRYPVSLGRNPFNRKTFYDCQSTPEGDYWISIVKPVSAFHKSIGVSYPNQEDRKRYEKARIDGKLPVQNGKVTPIGGSITIHGGGIGNNWTWGCIAMRNSDLDEIFSNLPLKAGIPIQIRGVEVKM